MRSVFSKLDQTEILEPEVIYLSDVLKRITTIPVEEADGFPQLLCLNCIILIHAAYKFQIQFDNSYALIQEYLASVKKGAQDIHNVESDDDDDLVFMSSSETFNSSRKHQNHSIHEVDQNRTLSKRKSNYKGSRRLRKVNQGKLSEGTAESEINLEKNNQEVVKSFPCPVCTKEFPALELREHARLHKALKKYLSIPDNKKVKSNVRFYADNVKDNAFVSIHNQKEKMHKCVMCNEEFSALDLRLHLNTHRNQKEYKCDQCERIFRKMNHLNTHRVKHLKEFPFKCEQCGKGFVIKTNYECHMLTHNANQELPYECSQCLRRFYNPEHLNRHMVLHTENISYSVKYKVCKCYHCLKTFKDRDELKSHQCVPIQETRKIKYPCKDCGKVFKNSAALYNHTRNIHRLNGAKVLCSVCGVHVANIYNHMMRHTGKKPYQCTQCGKRFIGKPQLKQHLLVHSGLKPFVCSVCAKAFNNHYNLQVHERIHKGDKCHICTICNKGFLEKSYLKKHMNVHAKVL
ncbi:zinc finger protein [Holotrichia oblita]|uniref:Zinc finger protein n=1 Tax=Holotrichia oblita TaxID=644536 RepID=A0ACB9T631_HOLOL|nr:zinc finger protein [Holotrichia oblita]